MSELRPASGPLRNEARMSASGGTQSAQFHTGPDAPNPAVAGATFDDVMAALSRLLDLQMQHGQVEGAIEFLTGLTADRVEALGGVPNE